MASDYTTQPPEGDNVTNMPKQAAKKFPPIPPTNRGEEDIKSYNR
jgi:hypothetical protein